MRNEGIACGDDFLVANIVRSVCRKSSKPTGERCGYCAYLCIFMK
ncbi:hypothetical protein [Ruminococcus sp.]|nr:hypothetical protein [Ruminococcus sp.]